MGNHHIQAAKASQYKPSSFRILQVTPFFPPDKGGIANHLGYLCAEMVNHGNKVTVIAPNAKKQDPKIETIDVKSAHLPGWPYPTLRSFSIPLDFGRKISSLLKTGKFDIVHTHGHHYPITWLAIRAAQKYNVPSVLTLHGMYALNPNVLGGKTRIEGWFNELVFRRLLTKTTAVIGLTNQITNYARQYGSGNVSYHTIANGVNSKIFSANLSKKKEFRTKYGLSDNGPVVLFVGRFEHVKAVLEVVDVAKSILSSGVKAEFLIIGAGSLDRQVRQVAANSSRIHVLPWQPPEKIHEFFIASDIFAIPSRFEALPLTVIEAMAAGLHIVYTPVGGVPEILEGYRARTLLQESSFAAIKTGLSRLLQDGFKSEKNNPIAANFDWSKIYEATSRVYEQAISAR